MDGILKYLYLICIDTRHINAMIIYPLLALQSKNVAEISSQHSHRSILKSSKVNNFKSNQVFQKQSVSFVGGKEATITGSYSKLVNNSVDVAIAAAFSSELDNMYSLKEEQRMAPKVFL